MQPVTTVPRSVTNIAPAPAARRRRGPPPRATHLHPLVTTRTPLAWLAEAAGVAPHQPHLAADLVRQRQAAAADGVALWEMPGVQCPVASDTRVAAQSFFQGVVSGVYAAPMRFSPTLPAGTSAASPKRARCGAATSFTLPNDAVCRVAWDPEKTPCAAVFAALVRLDPLLSHATQCIAVPHSASTPPFILSFSQDHSLPTDPAAAYTVLPARLPP